MNDLFNLSYRPCVGLMIINDKNNIFTGQRLDFISTAWQMPQGGIDEGEEELQAAFRELQEETSITQSKVELLACRASATALEWRISRPETKVVSDEVCWKRW
jgi:putative (di)nucleoside polyphosphate hydrolase